MVLFARTSNEGISNFERTEMAITGQHWFGDPHAIPSHSHNAARTDPIGFVSRIPDCTTVPPAQTDPNWLCFFNPLRHPVRAGFVSQNPLLATPAARTDPIGFVSQSPNCVVPCTNGPQLGLFFQNDCAAPPAPRFVSQNPLPTIPAARTNPIGFVSQSRTAPPPPCTNEPNWLCFFNPPPPHPRPGSFRKNPLPSFSRPHRANHPKKIPSLCNNRRPTRSLVMTKGGAPWNSRSER